MDIRSNSSKIVCNLFHIIKHMSTGLYVYELRSTCPQKSVAGNLFVFHKALDPYMMGRTIEMLHISNNTLSSKLISYDINYLGTIYDMI